MVWAHRMVLSGPAKTGSDHQEGPPRQPRGCQVRPTCHSRPQPGRAGSLQAAATHPQTGCAVCPGRPPSVLTASLALRPLAASRRRGTPGEAATSLRRMIPQTWPRLSATWLTAEGAGHPGFPWRCQAPKQNTLGWALWVRSPTMPAEGLGVTPAVGTAASLHRTPHPHAPSGCSASPAVVSGPHQGTWGAPGQEWVDRGTLPHTPWWPGGSQRPTQPPALPGLVEWPPRALGHATWGGSGGLPLPPPTSCAVLVQS